MRERISRATKVLLVLTLSTELKKRFLRLKSQLILTHARFNSLQGKVLNVHKGLSNWFYEQDITKRRVEHDEKWIGFGTLLITAAWVVSVLPQRSVAQIVDPIVTGLRALIGLLYSVAEVLQMPDPGEFVTQIVAYAVAVFGIGVINWIVLRRIIKQPEPPEPDIFIDDGYKIPMEDKARVWTLSIHNEGDTAALSCRAGITFDGLDRRDILEIPNIKSHINSETFDYIALNRSALPWISFPDLASPKDFVLHESMEISAGDKEQLGILKVVPAGNGIPEHFEILSAIKGQAIACLRKKRLYGRIKVTPQNGEPETRNFRVAPPIFTRDWRLSLE